MGCHPGSEEPTGNDTESVDDERSLEDIFDQVETDDDGESDNPFDEGADEEPAFEENETAVDEGPGFDEEDEFEGGEEDAADEGPGFGDDDEFGDNDETDDEGIGDDNEEAEGGDSGPDDGSENTTQDDSDPSETNVSGGGAEALMNPTGRILVIRETMSSSSRSI
ncbi:MAG: hypothetical protein U5K37_10290 [Natrialbaceae archaeon]|nr:hypothetical protein [Natrialbaceae archaeon]